MAEENKVDNTTDVAAGNTAPEAKEPNFPEIDKGQVKPETKVEPEPQDPEYAAWKSQDHGMTWKRYQDSAREAKKLKEEVELARQQSQQTLDAASVELRKAYEKDPETFSKLFGVEATNSQEGNKQPQQQPMDPATLTRHVQTQIEISSFYERNKEHIGDEQEWDAVQDLAVGFVGKKERSGKPYTIQTALRDALILRRPDLIADKAVMDHLTSQAKRESASEPGDVPSGSSSGEVEATDEEISFWRETGGEALVKKMITRRRKQGSR